MKMMKQLMVGALAVAMGIASAWAENEYTITVPAFTLITSEGRVYKSGTFTQPVSANQPLPNITQLAIMSKAYGAQGWTLSWDGQCKTEYYYADGSPVYPTSLVKSNLVLYPTLDYVNLSRESRSLNFASYQVKGINYEVNSISVTPGDSLPTLKSAMPEAVKAWIRGWYLQEGGRGEKIYDANGNACFSMFPRHDDLKLYPLIDASRHPLVTNTVSFTSYVVNGKTYAVDSVKAAESSMLPDLPSATLHPWLKGWYTQPECQGEQVYDANGRSLIGTWNRYKDVTLYAGLDSTKLEHNLHFADFVADGKTYKVDAMTFVPGEALADLPAQFVQSFVEGWYTGEKGTGTQYFDANGKPVITPSAQMDVTLYAWINYRKLPTNVFVNGQQLNAAVAEGRSGEGWAFDSDNDLVTFNRDLTFHVTGTNDSGVVHFLVADNATLVVSNLELKTTSTSRLGCIAVASGVKVNIQLKGESQLDASGAAGVAGIYCPTGASVKIFSSRTRDVSLANPTNMSYHGVLTQEEYATKDLVVKGGANAAAIGGRQGSDGGLSGQITIENCSLWATGGSSACDIGPTSAGKTSANANDCGTIRFLKWPNVRRVSQGSSEYPSVFPNPHGDWETPVFSVPVWCSNSIHPSNVNVYWFPYGTTYLIALEYTDMGHLGATRTVTTRTITIKHNAN